MSTVRGEIELEGRPLLQVIDQGIDPRSDQKALALDAQIVHRPSFAHVEVKLPNSQSQVLAQNGAMLWMDSNIQMKTDCYGGCCHAYYRQCAFEYFCLNMYTGPATEDGKGASVISFGFDLPGDILPFASTADHGWVLTCQSFVCGTPNTLVSAKFAGCCVCLFGGEGMFLTHIKSTAGTALFYAGGYGQIQRHEVPAGKVFCINNGLFFATSDKTQFSIGMPGGCKSLCFSGEGLVMKFTGPCIVYTQNRDPEVMYKLLNPYPDYGGGDSNDNGAAGAAAGAAS